MNEILQTSCLSCQLDIEGPFDEDTWTDRGGNPTCPRSKGERHQPWPSDVVILDNRKRLMEIAAPIGRWVALEVEDENYTATTLNQFAGAAMQVETLLSEDEPIWAHYEKELAQIVTAWAVDHCLTEDKQIPPPEIRASIRGQMDGGLSTEADYGWCHGDIHVSDWLCGIITRSGVSEFWWLGEDESWLPQAMIYAVAYFLGWSQVWEN
jgi:hypothetical protein